MKRPNKLDWLVYSIFRWWWNPILQKHPNYIYGMVYEMNKWWEEYVQEIQVT